MLKKLAWAFALITLFLLVAAGAFLAGTFYTKPLAEPMAIQPAQNEPTATAQPKQLPTEASQAVQPQPKGSCGETGVKLLLFTGADFSIGVPPLGADSVRVVKVDYDNKKITVVAFPRDLWVKTAELAELKYPETRLGLAYHFKKEATDGSDKHKITLATALIGQTLYDNFGLTPQYYFTLQLDNTAAMVDTINGIEITVPEEITTERGVVISAGPQTMDGKIVTEYVRSFVKGETSRLKRQNLFVKALQNKLLSAEILPKVPDLYKQFDKAIVTDLSPKQLADLACMAEEVPQDQIAFHEVNGDLVTAQADGALIPNVEKIKAKLNEWLGQ
jgi:LCP family protein required for cell wall assembly